MPMRVITVWLPRKNHGGWGSGRVR
jgi:hypothetical protein